MLIKYKEPYTYSKKIIISILMGITIAFIMLCFCILDAVGQEKPSTKGSGRLNMAHSTTITPVVCTILSSASNDSLIKRSSSTKYIISWKDSTITKITIYHFY